MTSRRAPPRVTPLALIILGFLSERPMHPYEMQRVARERGTDEVVKIQRGSLYPAVERLALAGLVAPLETSREGRRPERTVYQLTPDGRETLENWLGELLSYPHPEFPRFPAALSVLPTMTPERIRAMLVARCTRLVRDLAAVEAALTSLTESMGLPRIFLIEDQYRAAMMRAELEWVSALVDDLGTGA
jgi:DNA-binding PadR family transcriptional regulator